MEHFHCVTVLAAARDLLTNSIEISQYRRSQGLDKQGFEFIVRFFSLYLSLFTKRPVGSPDYTDIYAIVHPVFTLQSVDICRFQRHNLENSQFPVFLFAKRTSS